MRFYNRQHQYYCGIDLHVKTMYVCILDQAGQVLVHRNVASTPAAFLEVVGPYRTDLAVAAECMFTWYWLADLCAAEHLTFVLGHALAMTGLDDPLFESRLNGQIIALIQQNYTKTTRYALGARRVGSVRGELARSA